jgi:hypothetical protein
LGLEGVLGERVFLDHRTEIAAHHIQMAKVLTALAVLGLAPMVWVWQDWCAQGRGLGDLLVAIKR